MEGNQLEQESVAKRYEMDGGGQQTLEICSDIWLEDTALQELVTSPLSADKHNHRVCDYWLVDEGQRWGEFSNLFPSVFLLKLASTIISNSKSEIDHLGWKTTASGQFSVKSAHELEAGWDQSEEWKGWKLIYKLKVQERIRVLL